MTRTRPSPARERGRSRGRGPRADDPQNIVYCTALGVIPGPPSKTRVGIAKSTDGGLMWDALGPQIWKEIPTSCGLANEHDRPSVDTSADGQQVWLAYSSNSTMPIAKQVRVAYSIDGGNSWQDRLVATLVDPINTDPVPIVKRALDNPMGVFVAFQDDGPTTGACTRVAVSLAAGASASR